MVKLSKRGTETMSKLGEALEVWIQFITATVAMDNVMQKVWDEAADREQFSITSYENLRLFLKPFRRPWTGKLEPGHRSASGRRHS